MTVESGVVRQAVDPMGELDGDELSYMESLISAVEDGLLSVGEADRRFSFEVKARRLRQQRVVQR